MQGIGRFTLVKSRTDFLDTEKEPRPGQGHEKRQREISLSNVPAEPRRGSRMVSPLSSGRDLPSEDALGNLMWHLMTHNGWRQPTGFPSRPPSK